MRGWVLFAVLLAGGLLAGADLFGRGVPAAPAESEVRPLAPQESEGRPWLRGEREVAGGRLVLSDGGVFFVGDETVELLRFAAEPPSVSEDGRRFVVVGGEPEALCPSLHAFAFDGGWVHRVVEEPGCPDRAALSPDGSRLAWISDRTGFPAVWVRDFGGGEAVQLTNVGLEDRPPVFGRAPDGFVPPPHPGRLRWEGGEIAWDAEDGPRSVRAP